MQELVGVVLALFFEPPMEVAEVCIRVNDSLALNFDHDLDNAVHCRVGRTNVYSHPAGFRWLKDVNLGRRGKAFFGIHATQP